MPDEVYVIAEILKVHDEEGLGAYQQGARVQLRARGGSVVARGTKHVEGPRSGVVMIQRWPSEEAFRAWQDSEEYQPLKEARRKAFDLRLVIVPAV